MSTKKVLFIEDRIADRRALYEMMRVRGFDVFCAESIDHARALAENHWEEIDVAVLDMRLELYPDAVGDNSHMTGADIGIEVKLKKNCFPPEIIINSVYSELDYYRLALKLGVAAYLSKLDENNVLDVVRHVKILALRHALNGENPRTAKRIARIASQSQSPSDAVLRFCQEILKPEIESCLEVPFVILFSNGDKTVNCANNSDLPAGPHHLYHTLQALTHGMGSPTSPFVLEADKLNIENSDDAATRALCDRLNGTAFLPLSVSANLKLSIGILQEGELGTPEDALPLCKILAQYLRPTVLENMLNIWSQWTKIRTLRYNTAKLCLFVGQELKDVLPSGEEDAAFSLDSLTHLYGIAEDLSDTGELLTHIEKKQLEGQEGQEEQTVSVREVIEETWPAIASTVDGLTVEGDCAVAVDKDDMEIIISRLLHWYFQRRSTKPFDVDPKLLVKCEETLEGSTITFEDTSDRLDVRLRADMFAPFTQAAPIPFSGASADANKGASKTKSLGRYLPLYIAKMLVEGRYLGVLEDRSDDIKGHDYGNRIIMQIPSNSER